MALKSSNSLKSHLQRLKARHVKLQARIDSETRRPLPDDMLLQKLKRLRLKTKDEIALIFGVMRFVNRPPLPDVA